VEAFWQWLLRIDARVICGALCGCALLLAVAALLHIGFAGTGSASQLSALVGQELIPQPVQPGTVTAAEGNHTIPASPFQSRYLDEVRNFLEGERQRAAAEAEALRLEAECRAQWPEETEIAEVEPPPPPPSTPSRILRIVYQGSIRRTDQTVVALVKDDSTGAVTHHRVGDRVEDLTIKEIQWRHLVLGREGAEDIRVPVHEPTEIEVPPAHESY
jgi:hypothetical protein